jgi:tRNA G37 N-methylase TrmD
MLIEALTSYPTQHGIDTTPTPKFVPKNQALNHKRIDQWLLDNSLRIAQQTRNDFMHTQLKCIDLKNMSQADRDALNVFLWDDPHWND